jgi:hypothetical protein
MKLNFLIILTDFGEPEVRNSLSPLERPINLGRLLRDEIADV